MTEPKSNATVYIIIPAYNEGPVILDVLREVSQPGYQVVIVDDGSSDNTYQRVSESQANSASIGQIHLLRHTVNLGQGAALATGIQYALAEGARILVTFDADGQHLVSDIPALIAPILSEEAEVVLGSRFLGTQQGESLVNETEEPIWGATVNIPWGRRVLLKFAILFTGLTEKIWLSDAHNGLRAFSAEAAKKIKITQNRMAHASEIVSEISRLKLRYVEVPVHIRYTDYSRMKGQRASDAINIMIELLEVLFTGEER